MKFIPDGEEAAREFSKGLTAAVEEFNRGVATLALTALFCALGVTIVAVLGASSLLRSSLEDARVRNEAQALSQQIKQQTRLQEADARSLMANLQYLRMWYGDDKNAIAQYWTQRIINTAAIWQAKNPEKDVKVVVIDHEKIWPVWDIVLEHARNNQELYRSLVCLSHTDVSRGLSQDPITMDDERRFVAKDLKEAIHNAESYILRHSSCKKETFALFIYADLRGPLGPSTVEPVFDVSNALWLGGFHIIGNLVNGKPRYAISEDSTVTLNSRAYCLREKVSEEHLEDIVWHSVESRPSRPSKKSGPTIWYWFWFLLIVSIIVGMAQLLEAGILILLIMAVLYIVVTDRQE